MQEANLPSPNLGAKGYHLRRIAANAISHLEVVAQAYADGAAPDADDLVTFFTTCAAAAATTGKPAPVVGLTAAGNATSVEVGKTLQLTFAKGGSSGAVTYSTSDATKATVNASGLVTGVATGPVTITATMAEGTAHKAASAKISLTVIAAEGGA